MKRLPLLTLLFLAVVCVAVDAQVGHEGPLAGIFQSRSRPAFTARPIPTAAAFFTIDPSAFDRMAGSGAGPVAINGFHLTDTRVVNLTLERFKVLADDARIVEGRMSGGDRPAVIDPGIFLKGSVEGVPGSFVYFAVFRDYCTGYIEIPEGAARVRYSVAPLELAEGLPSLMVTYNEQQALALQPAQFLAKGDWGCGAETVPGYGDGVKRAFETMERATGKGGKNAPRTQSNTILAVQIALEGDSAFYVAHGRNLSRAANYALTVIGAMSAIYQRDLNTIALVPYLRIWTGADPYPGTNTGTLLPQVRTYWMTNMAAVSRTMVHVFGVSAIGGGIAYLNTLCNSSFGYAVCGLNNNVTYPTTAYVWDSDVTSHETGHIFGSPHTHSCTWAPAIDSCYTAEGSCFAGTSPRTGTIMSYCHLTAFGTLLNFHPRVATLMRTNVEAAGCAGAFGNTNANDVAVGTIQVPATGGAYASGASFTPQAVFRNAGTNTQTNLSVNITIRDSLGVQVYSNSQTIGSLAPGASTSVSFAATSIATIARYNVTATITLASDGFQANNTMVRPFEIVSSVTGSVTVTAPNTAVVLRAGTTTNITWSTTGGLANGRIDFSPDDGATWYTVRSDLGLAAGSYSWLVPAFATTRARIRVADRDNAATYDMSDVAFTISTVSIDYQWARRAGSPLAEEARGVATDTRGNVYMAGTFSDSLLVDSTWLVSAGGTDAFVAKYTPGGSLIWARRFGGASNDSAFSVAIDANGNAYVVGSFIGTATVGATPLVSSGDADIVIAKFDANGNATWAVRAGGAGRDQARAVGVDNAGNAYIGGTFAGSVTFGGTTLTATGMNDAFIARCAPAAGTFDWAARGGGADMDEAYGIGVDGTGNCAITGRYRVSATFGATTLAGSAGDDGFVARYNSSGTFQWAASVVGSGAEDGRGVAIDASGNVIWTGTHSGTVNFGTTVVANGGGRDCFIAKYSSGGSIQWVRPFGGTSDDYANALAVDAAGNAYVGGYFTTQMRVAELTLSANGGASTDAFAVKFAPDGWPDWAQRGGGTRAEEAWGITVNGTGENAYTVGRFTYTTPVDQPSIIGGDTLAGRGVTDAFVARLGTFRITNPRERQELRVGDVTAIMWTPMSAVNVKLEFSTDNGATWSTITSSTANTGTYSWTVPVAFTQLGVIRVTDVDNPAINGAAWSGTFRITSTLPPTGLTATPHNGSVDLVWTAPGGPTPTSYAIYRTALPAAVPASLTPVATVAGNQTAWTDASVVNCTEYAYAVKSLMGANESVFSNLDSARPEAPRFLNPTAPMMNERIPAGTNQTIRWNTSGCLDSVRIELWTQRTGTWATVTARVPNTGAYQWAVPQVASTRAMLRLTATNDGTVIGRVDTFAICSASATIVPSGPGQFCEGDSVVLLAPPGFVTYAWSNGATTQRVVARVTGSYSVSVSDSAGCTASSAAFDVLVNPAPRPRVRVVAGTPTICEGDSVTLDAGDGYTAYLWSNGATTKAITVHSAGTYYVRVGNAGGCGGGSDSVIVTVNPNPRPKLTALGPTQICEGDSVVLDAGDGYVAYIWSNGSNMRKLTVRQSGTYYVRTANAAGCPSRSDSIVVSVVGAPQPVVTAFGGTTLCQGDSVMLDAGPGYGSYRWSNGATTQRIVVRQAGSYTVTVSSGSNCSGTSTPLTITVNPKPAKPSISQTSSGDSLIYNGVGGRISWRRNDTLVGGAEGRALAAPTPGRYTVTVTDGNGCSETSDPIDVNLESGVGLAETGDRTLMIHPNPTVGLLTFEADIPAGTPLRAVLTDMSGREVMRVEAVATAGGYHRTLDISRLPSGAYLIDVRAGLRKWTRTVVKQ